MLEAAFWAAVAASSLLIGAAIALRWPPRRRVVGLVLGFGAGALVSAVAYELVETAIEEAGGTGVPAFGFVVGALAFFLGDWAIDRRGGDGRKGMDAEPEGGNPAAIVLGTVLDGVPESIVIGGGLALGGGVSVPMLAATFLSNLPEALGATVGLRQRGTPPGQMLGMWLGIAAISAVSGALGYLILDGADPTLGAFFHAFAAGAVLTMLADTMMPEAYEEGGKAVGLCTALGFGVAVWLSTFE